MTIGDFSAQAAAYGRTRPGYPEPLLDSLLAEASVDGDFVVDFGAGIGIFTRMLANRGFNVTAVEPSKEMIPRADLPRVRWVQGTFEKNSLSDQSHLWAVEAQAFDWAEVSSTQELRQSQCRSFN